jgi:hypothetical protein
MSRRTRPSPLSSCAGKEYAALSATPNEYAAFVDQISKMWFGEPNWTAAEPAAIDTHVLVVDGDHDEAIKRVHTEYIAATIPHAGLLTLPNVSHFAFLQDPNQFNSPSSISLATNDDRDEPSSRSLSPGSPRAADGRNSRVSVDRDKILNRGFAVFSPA